MLAPIKRTLKIIILSSLLLIQFVEKSYSQEECGRPADLFYRPLQFQSLQEPDDEILKRQFEKLQYLDQLNILNLQKNRSFKTIPLGSLNSTKQHGYTIDGLVTYWFDTKAYKLQLFLVSTCGLEIAQAEVSFQMYPSWNAPDISQQAITKLMAGIDIWELEHDLRDSKNYGLGGDIWGGSVMITMENKLVKGEETRVVMMVVDCDGRVLKNKEISTEGTKGGIFTPAKFKTDDEGMAITKFKMTTDKTAIVKATCETQNVWSCKDLYTGTQAVKGIEGFPVKVSINYYQDETKTLKRVTLPGIEVKGGETAETFQMRHRSVMYHFPSPESIKEGYLVAVTKEPSYPESKTENITESGWYAYTKSVQNAQISGMPGNIEMVKAEEKGQEEMVAGEASVVYPSEVTFYKGNKHDPPQISWSVDYPAININGDASAYGAIGIIKGEPGVVWKVNKITDPKSIYKTEYNISLTLDAAEELKKGDIALKKMFGFDLEGLSKTIDPTKPSQSPAGAYGKQIINVRILSPYPDE